MRGDGAKGFLAEGRVGAGGVGGYPVARPPRRLKSQGGGGEPAWCPCGFVARMVLPTQVGVREGSGGEFGEDALGGEGGCPLARAKSR